MFLKKKKYELLNKSIDRLIYILEKGNIEEFAFLLGNKKELLKRNLLAGISKGIGIGIGVTLISAMLIYLMQKIVTLNIPIIGKYIADIVKIVEKSR